MTALTTYLRSLGACAEAVTWAETQPDLPTAWSNCQRSDWMLWLLDKRGYKDERVLRLLACDFAEAELHLVSAGEDRPKQAIEVARRYANGDATKAELSAARATAYAARAAAYAAAADAAYAAARAAAARAAADAARAAAYATARAAQADTIRRYLPICPEVLK